jgi:hypothetical protein
LEGDSGNDERRWKRLRVYLKRVSQSVPTKMLFGGSSEDGNISRISGATRGNIMDSYSPNKTPTLLLTPKRGDLSFNIKIREFFVLGLSGSKSQPLTSFLLRKL